MAEVVLDASALVELLLRTELGVAVERRIRGEILHAPAHLDAEVLSALGRLHRAGAIDEDLVAARLASLRAATIERHPLGDLLSGAWSRRHRVRLVDALYLQLAQALGAPLVTTDQRLRAQPSVEVVEL